MEKRVSSIKSLLRFPRVKLAEFPTPLEEARKLSTRLGIWMFVKRDDTMHLALGGNKVRKLELLMAEAKARGCDTVVTGGALTSNHARLTAAASRKLGMDCVLVLSGKKPSDVEGNLLLDMLLGADVRFTDVGRENLARALEEVAADLESEGRRPYVIPPGGANGLGVIGYVLGALEIAEQIANYTEGPDYVVHATGTGATQAGLVTGFKLAGLDTEVVGISVGRDQPAVKGDIIRLIREVESIINRPINVSGNDIIVIDDYTFGGYGIVKEEVVNIIKKVAKEEGILLDPVYTAKAMYGLEDLANRGYFEQGASVVFLHTGGLPIIFSHVRYHGI